VSLGPFWCTLYRKRGWCRAFSIEGLACGEPIDENDEPQLCTYHRHFLTEAQF
jgi:hypothetical protein